MALSGAERQKRHRERVKAALRNGGQVGIRSLPAILADLIDRGEDGFSEVTSIETFVAQAVLSGIRGLGCHVAPEESPEITAFFGGEAYIDACRDWSSAKHTWDASKKKDKGPEPLPPSLPCVT